MIISYYNIHKKLTNIKHDLSFFPLNMICHLLLSNIFCILYNEYYVKPINMSKVTKFESNTALKKTLPQGDIIVMNALEGWEDLEEEQRAYLSTYFDTFPKRVKACMKSGISTSSYERWINNDAHFNKIMKLIEFIHLEELKDIEYAESYTDSKTRARFLKAMEDGGYGGKKNTTNNTLNIEVKGMSEAKEFLDNMSDNS